MAATVQTFFHEETFTFTHWVQDQATGKVALIDPVLDFDQKSGRTATRFIDDILKQIQEKGAQVALVLETHAHADHLSAGDYIRQQTRAQVVIGKPIIQVQETFANLFNERDSFKADGHQFDVLVAEGAEVTLGESVFSVLATPGHTPACVSYFLNGTDVFVGDTIFMPDIGSARCDFPGGDARVLFQSVQRLLSLGDDVVMHLCHDYPPEGRALASSVTVAQQKERNIHMRAGISCEKFVEMREARDATLDVPRLILPSLQVNIRAGALPEPEENGVSYLKLPLNAL
ncbi:MAG: MBL fold metallo-hydrolase [Oceanospirillaceae bacterium]|nr:MBL fold metallo-hydrolase [Oceanospirillaceae bacterium]|tara:strand:+ start:1349 stop:2212 length:864 start_codon:yes stop_codon:yes gene_type:complete